MYLDLNSLKFSQDFSQLHGIKERGKCPQCCMKRKFYCYDCALPVSHNPPKPSHRLPLKVIIVRHNSEKPSKSSVIPLKLAYPNDVELYTFTQPNRFDASEKVGTISPPFSDEINWNKTAILFPHETAKSISNLPLGLLPNPQTTSTASSEIDTVVVIDSTWSTALQVIEKTPQLRSVQCMIKLGSANETIFWRHQRIGRECLATCEAVYVFLRELWDYRSEVPYDGRFDDVLYYYVYIHTVVNDHYRSTKRHRSHIPAYALTPSQ